MEESLTIEPLQSFNGPEITSIGRSSVLHAGSYGSHLKSHEITGNRHGLPGPCSWHQLPPTMGPGHKGAKRKANALGSSIDEGFKGCI